MSDNQGKKKRDSQVRHQQQFVWQILAPVLLSLIIVLCILVLLVLNAGNAPTMNEKWAHISTIFLSLPVILFGILTLAVVLLLAWLIHKLRKSIPPLTSGFFQVVHRVNEITNQVTEKSLSPLIHGKSYAAGVKRLLSMAFHISNDREE